jgi:hypothetical protein
LEHVLVVSKVLQGFAREDQKTPATKEVKSA